MLASPKQFALTIVDSIITAPLRERNCGREYCRTLLSPKTRHFDRPAAAVNLVDALVPGAARRVAHFVIRHTKLPLAGGRLELAGYGSGDTVFEMRWGSFRFVLKVQRESLGLGLEKLLRLASIRKCAYQSVCSSFGSHTDLFPPTDFLILHGPLFSRPAAAAIQPFIEGSRRDLLRDYSDDELRQLLSRDWRLRDQCTVFVEQMTQALESDRWMLDLGRNNLVVVTHNQRNRLIYMDAEMIEAGWLRANGWYGEYRGHLQRLGSVLKEL